MEKIALITGVSRELGLGFETAKQLEEIGYKVIITGRDLDKVSVLAEKIGVLARELDITDDKSISNFLPNFKQNLAK